MHEILVVNTLWIFELRTERGNRSEISTKRQISVISMVLMLFTYKYTVWFLLRLQKIERYDRLESNNDLFGSEFPRHIANVIRIVKTIDIRLSPSSIRSKFLNVILKLLTQTGSVKHCCVFYNVRSSLSDRQ